MITFPILIVLIVLFRALDGVEHGVHWASKPQKDESNTFHDADLFQTWFVRAAYAVILYNLVTLWWLLPAVVGLSLADQAIWQMLLNRFASGDYFGGELEGAVFSPFGIIHVSDKTFSNQGRPVQLLLGLALLLLSFSFGLV